ncbi:MAG TPA: rhodanese-like domain-containing protein [Chloroflexota bacterium]|nr:rhodanese-like domain-containing protein [Chloroflexota bacterium]
MIDSSVPTITVATLYERLQAGAALQLVDVREDWEWALGHIHGAVHIPLNTLPQRLSDLEPSREVAFICHLGMRSEMATQYALQHGFGAALNVTGGMDAWEAQQYPVE